MSERISSFQTFPCGACGAAVDPLRASQVAIFGDRFHYFCSGRCRERFSTAPPPSASPPSASPCPAAPLIEPALALDAAAASELPAELELAAEAPLPAELELAAERSPPLAPPHSSPAAPPGSAAPAPISEQRSRVRPSQRSAPRSHSSSPPRAARPRVLELYAAATFGLAALGLEIAGGGRVPGWLAPASDAVGCALLCWGTWRCRELVWRGPALLGLLAPVAATLTALASLLGTGRSTGHSASAAGAICFSAALSLALIARRWRARAPVRQRLEHLLRAGARRSSSDTGGELRPGEEFLLEPGERSPADAVIVAGRGRIEPWFESPLKVQRQEGDTLLAGARVVDGALRAVARWVGMDRAWARLTLDPNRRADRHAIPARLAERLCTSGALALGLLGALLAFSSQQPALILSSAAALAATLCSIGLPELVALQLSSGVHELLARGIFFREPGALDRASRVSAVVFCAEGTLFSDEPGVASIEPAGHLSQEELLALIAGAFAGVATPLASALQRCTQSHQVRPDATRSPNHTPGLGVTAVASSGQSLVVGTRAWLLERHISVAGAERRISELEALGRSVLLAALDGRYVGLLALQDGIAAGSRAAVQHLVDARVEAVLLSGQARETCTALARQLGIDHVRPEIATESRGNELQRLQDSLGELAVVGRASKDDTALSTVSLSINIDDAGGPLERWDVDVASGDVRDAAWAVHVARRLYAETTRSIITAAAPACVAVITTWIGMPVWLAPIAGAAGSALALHRADQQRRWLATRWQLTEPQADQLEVDRLRSDGPASAADIAQRAPAASS